MAGELGIPMVRLVDGTGGGGSVKTYEMTGFTYVPRNPGWEFVVDNLARVPVVSLGLAHYRLRLTTLLPLRLLRVSLPLHLPPILLQVLLVGLILASL